MEVAERLRQVRGALECLADLEEAIQAHTEWVTQVHRTLIFRHAATPDIIAEDAGARCAFGRWYDGIGREEVGESGTFAQIGLIHEKTHDMAASLVRSIESGQPDEALYEAFTAYASHLMELMRRLEGEVWSTFSTKDALTGLYNRQAMDSFLKRAGGLPAGCVALCDIDHFKRVNDTHGHQAGDDVLRVVAQTLMTLLRSSDTAFRYGGEEFLIYLAGVTTQVAHSICERLREALADMVIPLGHGRHLSITASFGIAPVVLGEASSHVIARADAALYLAKNTGRNKVCVHAL